MTITKEIFFSDLVTEMEWGGVGSTPIARTRIFILRVCLSENSQAQKISIYFTNDCLFGNSHRRCLFGRSINSQTCLTKGRTIRKKMGRVGNFQLARIFFFRSLLLQEFFFQVNLSAQIFFTTCEKVTIGPSAWIFFLPSSLHEFFFFWRFALHEFFLVFSLAPPPPPHHFSNGPSLIRTEQAGSTKSLPITIGRWK